MAESALEAEFAMQLRAAKPNAVDTIIGEEHGIHQD